MSSSNTLTFRKNLLSNPAAEFVEQTAGVEALMQLQVPKIEAEQLDAMVEFVPELDRFDLKGTSVRLKARCYQDSQQRMQQFKERLVSFVALLRDRQVDKELGITLKSPTDPDFTIDYILHIVGQIGEGPQGKPQSKARCCKSFVRKCYRKVDSNRGIVEGFLKLIPSDSYGTLISGGFAVILAAVEKHVKERDAIQNFLATIPDRLNSLQRLSDIHGQSESFHFRMDAMLVSIFGVLESIVDRLTDTWISKAKRRSAGLRSVFKSTTKLKHNADNVNVNESVPHINMKIADALREFQDQADRFQREVDMCSDESLAVMRRDLVCLRKDTKQKLDKVLEFIQRSAPSQVPLTPLELYNSLYNLFRAHEPKLIPPAVPLRDARKQNRKVAKHWDRDFEGFTGKSLCDIKDCLDQLEQLSFDDKSTSQAVLASAQVSSWLTKERSSMLLIDQDTPHWDLASPISFTSALLAITLQSTKRFPVLTFFCMHRNNQSTKENVSGLLALIQSLNVQLFDFICKHRPKVNLAEMEDHECFNASHRSYAKGLTLFSRLLSLLSENEMVYIIVDSFSFLSGDDKKIATMLERLKGMMRRHKHIVIKVLITDPLVGSPVYEMARISLHVQDLVGGPGVIDAQAEKRQIEERLKEDSSGE